MANASVRRRAIAGKRRTTSSGPERGIADDTRAAPRGQRVYEALLERIQSRFYGQGERLREDRLATEFGVSRTPVREALNRLLARALLEVAPGRGLIVVSISRQQLLELYEMREALEGTAARLAARHASPAEIEALQELNDQFRLHADDPPRLAQVNALLHTAIAEAAHNRYLQQSLDRLGDALALLKRTTFEVPGRPAQADDEHRRIVRAIARSDAEVAEAAARAHIREALKNRLRLEAEGATPHALRARTSKR